MKTIIMLIGLWVCCTCHAAEYFGERCLVDIDSPDVKQEQRIVRVKINLIGAKFDSIDPLPGGWTLTIKNESNGSASLEGEIDVGMAAVYVKDFVRTVSLRKYLANEQDFSIPVELTILGGFKESEDRHVKLNMTHIRLVKVGQSKDVRLTLHKPAESPRPPPSRC